MTKEKVKPLAKRMIAMKPSDWKFIKSLLTKAQIEKIKARGVMLQRVEYEVTA